MSPSAPPLPEGEPQLPPVPEKRYFAIGEVAQLCGVKPHVLRYWEQEFPQLKPSKRRGNRRYYQREDVYTVRNIRHLLYEEGFTISGARQRLKEFAALKQGKAVTGGSDREDALREIRKELEAMLRLLERF
jgi:DNA-binding transcriptional MerR regulator